MSGSQAFPVDFQRDRQLVNRDGTPTDFSNYFLNALYQRTGAGSGIPRRVSPPLTATTGGQNSGTAQGPGSNLALILTFDMNDVETVPVGGGVNLLPLKPGQDQQVYNGGAHSLNVFPQPGVGIDALTVNAPFVLPVLSWRWFFWWSTTQIRSIGGP